MSYFKSLRFWYLDVIVCYIIAALVAPADPMSVYLVFVPLMAIWGSLRFLLARRLSR